MSQYLVRLSITEYYLCTLRWCDERSLILNQLKCNLGVGGWITDNAQTPPRGITNIYLPLSSAHNLVSPHLHSCISQVKKGLYLLQYKPWYEISYNNHQQGTGWLYNEPLSDSSSPLFKLSIAVNDE